MRKRFVTVAVTAKQKPILEAVVRKKLAPQQLVERCRIVLMSDEQLPVGRQATELGVDRQRIRRWRLRWAQAAQVLADAEQQGASDAHLEKLVLAVLADEPRSGAPSTFSAEQMAAIIALACEPPADSGLPISHWTPVELAREATRRTLVTSISPRHLDRFLPRRTCDRTKANIG